MYSTFTREISDIQRIIPLVFNSIGIAEGGRIRNIFITAIDVKVKIFCTGYVE